MSSRHPTSWLSPLLGAFRRAIRHHPRPRIDTPRERAIRAATGDWLTPETLDAAPDGELAAHLARFQEQVSVFSFPSHHWQDHAGLARFAVVHVVYGADPLGVRLARCAFPGGEYHVAGSGAEFWFAVGKALAPGVVPDWRPGVVSGVVTLGLLPRLTVRQSATAFTQVARLYAGLLREFPDLDATDLDTFFARAGQLRGRELGPVTDPAEPTPERLSRCVRMVRAATPTKARVAEFTRTDDDDRRRARAAIADRDRPALWQLAGVSTDCRLTDADTWNLVRAAAQARSTDDIPDGADRDAVAVFHAALRAVAPQLVPDWTAASHGGLIALSSAFTPELAPSAFYRLGNVALRALREKYRVHTAEMGPLLATVAEVCAPPEPLTPGDAPGEFGGLPDDAFAFLRELATNNSTGWMATERERYHFALRTPVLELCLALAARYVGPVLVREYGWELETAPKPGKALRSINRNDFGRSDPYAVELGVVYRESAQGSRRGSVQLAVEVHAGGVWFGFRLPPDARTAGKRLRGTVQAHGELLAEALGASGALRHCEFGHARDDGHAVHGAADLRTWAAGKDLWAGRRILPLDPVLTQDALVGEVILTWDKLIPLLSAALDADPVPTLRRRAGLAGPAVAMTAEAFGRATYQHATWLARALELLALKNQLVLTGVPGTGKTHLARHLARYLTGDRADLVRLVQFHPGYSYEEFVEGIRPSSTGDQPTRYAVEPGLLALFARRASNEPSARHVLIIDEINRGNLSRVFGELLFLLEYRDQEVVLPYSKEPFRLPENLTILATMNPVDLSATALDQALRRRFSFLDVRPDAAILARYFADHPPADPDPTFGPRCLAWFESLNDRLARDAGPDAQIGHSYLMVPGLTEAMLTTIWDHQIRPALEAHQPGSSAKLAPPGARKHNRVRDES